jgi:hypothetical protein
VLQNKQDIRRAGEGIVRLFRDVTAFVTTLVKVLKGFLHIYLSPGETEKNRLKKKYATSKKKIAYICCGKK